MSVLIFVDGLLVEGDGPLAISSPVVDGLVATGQTGSLGLVADAECMATKSSYFALLKPTVAQVHPATDWPLGFATAVAMGLTPTPGRTWACLEFAHLHRRRDQLIFPPPQQYGVEDREVTSLIACLEAEFNHQGWSIHRGRNQEVVISSDHAWSVRTTPLAGLTGKSFLDSQPIGRDAKELLYLLTTGQLLLARFSGNNKRQQEGKLPINTPWIYGMHHGQGFSPEHTDFRLEGRYWSTDPVVAGLALSAGMRPLIQRESLKNMDREDNGEMLWTAIVKEALHDAATKLVFIHCGLPKVFPQVQDRQERLRQLDRWLLVPLAAGLALSGRALWLTTPCLLKADGTCRPEAVPWVMARGQALSKKRRFWQRQQVGEGKMIDMQSFRTMWIA